MSEVDIRLGAVFWFALAVAYLVGTAQARDPGHPDPHDREHQHRERVQHRDDHPEPRRVPVPAPPVMVSRSTRGRGAGWWRSRCRVGCCVALGVAVVLGGCVYVTAAITVPAG